MPSFKHLLFLGLLLFFLSPTALAQSNNSQVKPEKNLYSEALAATLKQMEKEWGKSGEETKERAKTDYRNMVVEKFFAITDDLPTQFGEYHVEYLDSQGLIAHYRKLRKQFPILSPRPMKTEGNRLRVTFAVYWVSAPKKNHLGFGLSDWSEVYFRFDCEKGEFVLDEVKLGGI